MTTSEAGDIVMACMECETDHKTKIALNMALEALKQSKYLNRVELINGRLCIKGMPIDMREEKK